MIASELADRIKSNYAPQIIDARSRIEFNQGHIPGAIHAPAIKILLRMVSLPEDRAGELVITCEHGPRALLAQRLLRARGYHNTTLLEGHMTAWRSANHPLE